MATTGANSVVSAEFEVFGHVQAAPEENSEFRRFAKFTWHMGCYFTKYCRDEAARLGIGGWVKNSKRGTIVGKMQADKSTIDQMISWLTRTGSPGCQIERCDISNYEYLTRPDFHGFTIRF